MTEADLQRSLAALPESDPSVGVLRFRRRAARAALLDVAYAVTDSPLGPLAVFVTPRGLVRLAYQGEPMDEVVAEVAARVSPRVVLAPEQTDVIRRELDAYFARRLESFSVPIDWTLVRGFARGLLNATAAIPFGQVATYGALAAAVGSPRAARAAGNALGSNPIPIVVPCHRVVHAGGGIGGYTGGLERKRALLQLEGWLGQ